MSLPLVIPGACQIRLLFTIGNEQAVNVLGATVTGSVQFGQTLANSVGAMIKSAWSAQVGALMAPTTSLVHVGVRDIRAPNQLEYLDSGAPVIGTGVGDALPPQTALVVTLRTAGSGKRFRGRIYLGGWTEGENDANGVSLVAANNAAVSFINAVAVGLPTSGLGLAVLSRPAERSVTTKVTTHQDGTTTSKQVGQTFANAGFATPMTSAESRSTRWETQRRRGNGRGTGAIAGAFVARAVFP